MLISSKFCISFSLHFWKVEVLNTYHVKFYLKILTGSQVILTLFLGFGRPPLLDIQKWPSAYQKSWHSVRSGSGKTSRLANFVCNPLRETRGLRRAFLEFSISRMPPRRCVVQDCSRVSDKELGIG